MKIKLIAISLGIIFATLLFAIKAPFALAIADGPDCYMVRNVKKDDSLNIRSKPGIKGKIIDKIPYDERYIKNLFVTHPPIKSDMDIPVWCKIKYNRTIGWVACRYLAEDWDNELGKLDEDCQPIINPWVEKSFIIILSTKSYSEAKKMAENASKNLKIKLDLRGLIPNKELGLTLKEAECKESAFYYPCYVPRGRWDNGEYISIEHSSAYKGFQPDYYIVIATSAEKDNTSLKDKEKEIKKIIPDAYLKKASVYMGCMH